MRRCIVLLLLAAVFAVPSLAFADLETISFRGLMQSTSTTYVFTGAYEFQFLTPDGYWEDDPVLWEDDSDLDEKEHHWVPPCDNNGNGIPDVTEFGVLQAVLADTGNPNHLEVHAAYRKNRDRAGTDLGGLSASVSPDLKKIMGAYVTLGDGSYQSQLISGTRYGWGFAGSWGIVAEAIAGVAAYGSLWNSPDNAPDEANYARKPLLLSACGHADSDGVTNIAEFYGNGGIYTGTPRDPDTQVDDLTLSLPAEEDYVAAALATGTTSDGGDLAEVCTGAPPGGLAWGENLWYNPVNKVVYAAGPSMPWTVGRSWAQTSFTIGPAKELVVGDLATIDSAELNAWLVTNVLSVLGDNMWTGGTDQATEGNWKWIATGVQFWSGVAAGSAVGGAYTNWNGGEPNDASNEDYMEINTTGGWNDNGASTARVVLVQFTNGGVGYDDTDSNGYPEWWETFLPAPPGPVPRFSADPTSGNMPLEVQFTDLSVNNGSIITAWAWDFGDGGTSDERNPTHTYTALDDPSSTYTVSLTVTNIDGSDTETKTDYITVNYVCAWADMEEQAEAVAADPASVNEALGAALAGVDTWAEWDLDGDLLPDAAQIALLNYVVCTMWQPLNLSVYNALDGNAVLWTAQFAADDGLLANAEFFAGMAGLSADMQTALGGILGADLSGYAIYGLPSKVEALFSAGGDFDDDGLTNLVEWDAVVAYLGSGASLDALIDMFIDAATDPYNIGPYNPDLPVAGILGLGLLVGSMLAGAALAIRKK